jgi:DME family drug/metabolite transporter
MRKIALTPAASSLFALVLAAVLLGTVGIAAALWNRMQPTSPLLITLLRVGFAVPFLFTLAWATPRAGRRTRTADGRLVGVLGLALAVSQSLFFLALPLAGVTLVVVLSLCTAPLFVALASIRLFGERLDRRGQAAVGLAILGTGVLVLGGGTTPGADRAPGYLWGLAFALGSGVAYSALLLLAKVAAPTGDRPRSRLLAWAFAVAFVLLLPLTLGSGTLKLDLAPAVWGLAAYMGIVPTGLAYFLLQAGLQSASATLASVVILLESAVAAGLAWLVLGESTSLLQIGGAGLLIAGVGLLSWRSAPSP